MPRIKCPTCGKGTIDLSDIHPSLSQTLGYVQECPGLTPPEMLNFYPAIGVTAINQRLYRLMNMGLVRREPAGKAWRYYPAKR